MLSTDALDETALPLVKASWGRGDEKMRATSVSDLPPVACREQAPGLEQAPSLNHLPELYFVQRLTLFDPFAPVLKS